jgi:hypothetical protein
MVFCNIFAFVNQLGSMKKLSIISATLLLVFAVGFSSCSSKKKGAKCPAYGSTTTQQSSVKPA